MESAPALKESFFSAANLFWFSAGIAAEIVFLGLGVTPFGMSLGVDVAQWLGFIDPVTTAEGISKAAASTGVPALSFSP